MPNNSKRKRQKGRGNGRKRHSGGGRGRGKGRGGEEAKKNIEDNTLDTPADEAQAEPLAQDAQEQTKQEQKVSVPAETEGVQIGQKTDARVKQQQKSGNDSNNKQPSKAVEETAGGNRKNGKNVTQPKSLHPPAKTVTNNENKSKSAESAKTSSEKQSAAEKTLSEKQSSTEKTPSENQSSSQKTQGGNNPQANAQQPAEGEEKQDKKKKKRKKKKKKNSAGNAPGDNTQEEATDAGVEAETRNDVDASNSDRKQSDNLKNEDRPEEVHDASLQVKSKGILDVKESSGNEVARDIVNDLVASAVTATASSSPAAVETKNVHSVVKNLPDPGMMAKGLSVAKARLEQKPSAPTTAAKEIPELVSEDSPSSDPVPAVTEVSPETSSSDRDATMEVDAPLDPSPLDPSETVEVESASSPVVKGDSDPIAKPEQNPPATVDAGSPTDPVTTSEVAAVSDSGVGAEETLDTAQSSVPDESTEADLPSDPVTTEDAASPSETATPTNDPAASSEVASASDPVTPNLDATPEVASASDPVTPDHATPVVAPASDPVNPILDVTPEVAPASDPVTPDLDATREAAPASDPVTSDVNETHEVAPASDPVTPDVDATPEVAPASDPVTPDDNETLEVAPASDPVTPDVDATPEVAPASDPVTPDVDATPEVTPTSDPVTPDVDATPEVASASAPDTAAEGASSLTVPAEEKTATAPPSNPDVTIDETPIAKYEAAPASKSVTTPAAKPAAPSETDSSLTSQETSISNPVPVAEAALISNICAKVEAKGATTSLDTGARSVVDTLSKAATEIGADRHATDKLFNAKKVVQAPVVSPATSEAQKDPYQDKHLLSVLAGLIEVDRAHDGESGIVDNSKEGAAQSQVRRDAELKKVDIDPVGDALSAILLRGSGFDVNDKDDKVSKALASIRSVDGEMEQSLKKANSAEVTKPLETSKATTGVDSTTKAVAKPVSEEHVTVRVGVLQNSETAASPSSLDMTARYSDASTVLCSNTSNEEEEATTTHNIPREKSKPSYDVKKNTEHFQTKSRNAFIPVEKPSAGSSKETCSIDECNCIIM